MQRYSRHHGDFVFQICVSIAFGKEDLAIGYYHNFGTGHLVSSELNRENPVKKSFQRRKIMHIRALGRSCGQRQH